MATDAEIVKVLAEAEGWLDLQPNLNYTAMWRGRRNDMHALEDCPDYPNDVAAALRVCVLICRERDATFEIGFNGNTKYTVEFWGKKELNPRVGCSAWPQLGKANAPTLARAAALAAYQVLTKGAD